MDIHPRSRWHDPTFTERYGGFQLSQGSPRAIMNLASWDSVRRDMLVLLLRDLLERNVPGDIAELGVYKGETAKVIHHYAPEKCIHLYDTFRGFDPRDVDGEAQHNNRRPPGDHFADTSVEGVLKYISPLQRGNVHIHKGSFPESIVSAEGDLRYCLIHLDADLYSPTIAGLEYFYPRVERGGYILVHDFNAWPGARQAVSEFFKNRPELPIPMPDKSGTALIQKQ